MTRAEMAKACQVGSDVCEIEGFDEDSIGCTLAAAELAKDCAGCKHFTVIDLGEDVPTIVGRCGLTRHSETPVDGSGYCRPGWEAKP